MNAAPVEAPPKPAPRALRFVWPVQLGLVVVAALWALWFQLRLPSRLPSDEDYRAVADVLGREAQPGDVLVVYPWWADRVRSFLPELPSSGGVAGHGSDTLPVVAYLGYEHDPLVRYRRIWLLAQPELPKSDLEGFLKTFGDQRTRAGEARTFGTLELSLWTNGRARTIPFSASDALEAQAAAPGAATVYVERSNGARNDCPWTGDRFQCPGGQQLYVRTEWHEVFYQPKRCVWMYPPGGDARLVVEFPRALDGSSTDGQLEAGYIWEMAVKRGPGNTTTTVRVDDGHDVLADIALTPGLEGLQRAAFPLAGKSGPLRVSVQSQGTDSRWVCVDVMAFAGGAGGGPK